ncbi:hypothetical protein [Kaistella sp.]|uniref:hypothetical protein n=1 Tax=Kaistella sp. TaxID=2782235 RepID=UPI002F91D348
MDLIADRKADDSPIFRAHVERTLKEHARKMNQKQSQGYSGFTDEAFRGRSFQTDGDSLTYSHSALYRFVDTKKLRLPGGWKKGSNYKYKRQKVYDFHNRIIMGHYNGIMKDLIYGAAEDVKADMQAKLDNKLIG